MVKGVEIWSVRSIVRLLPRPINLALTVSCNTWQRKDLDASHEATSAISVGAELVRRAPRVFDAIRPVSEKGCHVAPDTATVASVP